MYLNTTLQRSRNHLLMGAAWNTGSFWGGGADWAWKFPPKFRSGMKISTKNYRNIKVGKELYDCTGQPSTQNQQHYKKNRFLQHFLKKKKINKICLVSLGMHQVQGWDLRTQPKKKNSACAGDSSLFPGMWANFCPSLGSRNGTKPAD